MKDPTACVGAPDGVSLVTSDTEQSFSAENHSDTTDTSGQKNVSYNPDTSGQKNVSYNPENYIIYIYIYMQRKREIDCQSQDFLILVQLSIIR